MHRVSLVSDEDLKVEFELGPSDTSPDPVKVTDNAASLQLAYTEVARGKTYEQAYAAFRDSLAVRWNYPNLSGAMTYMVVETCATITQALKKKHITDTNSKF